ncbi:MAG: hypothetical protein JWM09_179 [Francisellaceae bacterium]|nr:hypothetical protein [Francisellaceae bacterium]
MKFDEIKKNFYQELKLAYAQPNIEIPINLYNFSNKFLAQLSKEQIDKKNLPVLSTLVKWGKAYEKHNKINVPKTLPLSYVTFCNIKSSSSSFESEPTKSLPMELMSLTSNNSNTPFNFLPLHLQNFFLCIKTFSLQEQLKLYVKIYSPIPSEKNKSLILSSDKNFNNTNDRLESSNLYLHQLYLMLQNLTFEELAILKGPWELELNQMVETLLIKGVGNLYQGTLPLANFFQNKYQLKTNLCVVTQEIDELEKKLNSTKTGKKADNIHIKNNNLLMGINSSINENMPGINVSQNHNLSGNDTFYMPSSFVNNNLKHIPNPSSLNKENIIPSFNLSDKNDQINYFNYLSNKLIPQYNQNKTKNNIQNPLGTPNYNLIDKNKSAIKKPRLSVNHAINSVIPVNSELVCSMSFNSSQQASSIVPDNVLQFTIYPSTSTKENITPPLNLFPKKSENSSSSYVLKKKVKRPSESKNSNMENNILKKRKLSLISNERVSEDNSVNPSNIYYFESTLPDLPTNYSTPKKTYAIVNSEQKGSPIIFNGSFAYTSSLISKYQSPTTQALSPIKNSQNTK